MSQRGFTLLEVLVAAAALSIVLLGASSLFVAAVRFEQENSAEIFLQRQATMIKDEMARQIQEGSLASLAVPCAGGVANSLQVTNARGTYCFHRANDATGAATRFVEDRPDGGGGTWDLLSGAAATLSVATGDCFPGSGGFCPAVILDAAGQKVGAVIELRLRYRYPETSAFQTMTFKTTITPRNP